MSASAAGLAKGLAGQRKGRGVGWGSAGGGGQSGRAGREGRGRRKKAAIYHNLNSLKEVV